MLGGGHRSAQRLDECLATSPPDRPRVGLAGDRVEVRRGQWPDGGLEDGMSFVVGGETVFPQPGDGLIPG